MISRTLLYLRRKKEKTFTLFILLFLISTFITTSLALMYEAEQVSGFMRQSVGGRIEIRQLMGQESAFPLTQANINRIMSIQGIAGYNASNRAVVSGSNFSFRKNISSTESDNVGSIWAVNDSSLLIDFRDNRFSLFEGRHITVDDENAVMISEALAKENDLTVGDTISLSPTGIGIDEDGGLKYLIGESTASIDVKIIGIFAEEEVQLGAAWTIQTDIAANQLFSDHNTMTGLALANPGEYQIVTFHVQDPAGLPETIQEIRRIEGLDWDYFLMQHDDGDYMSISNDLQTVQNLILVLLIATCIISAIILMLILILRMRGRVHEVGILLSIGIGKKQILGGFLLEIIIIAILSFIVSYVATSLLLPSLSQGLLADLPALTELGEHQFEAMSAGMYGFVYMSILSVVLLTAYASTLLTIRLKPKQIHSKFS